MANLRYRTMHDGVLGLFYARHEKLDFETLCYRFGEIFETKEAKLASFLFTYFLRLHAFPNVFVVGFERLLKTTTHLPKTKRKQTKNPIGSRKTRAPTRSIIYIIYVCINCLYVYLYIYVCMTIHICNDGCYVYEVHVHTSYYDITDMPWVWRSFFFVVFFSEFHLCFVALLFHFKKI